MQIEIYNPAQGETIQPVKWNFEELKEQISTGLKVYENRVYTADDMAGAKKDRADLNRLSKAIDDKRKEMKKMYLAPYEEFEKQAKELTGLIDKQSAEIDKVVKEYEAQEKEQKQADIMAIYEESIGDLKDLVPYERIHDQKWLNKGTTLAKVKEAIENIAQKTKTMLAAIDRMGLNEDNTNRVKSAYLRNFDFGDALKEADQIKQEQKAFEEYEAKARMREEQAQRVADSLPQKETVEEPSECPVQPGNVESGVNVQPKEETPSEVAESAKLMKLEFRCWVTKAQMDALKAFLKEQGIEYGKVD